jgi:hypothetical protein
MYNPSHPIYPALAALALSGLACTAYARPAIDMAHLSDTEVAMEDQSKPGAPGKTFFAATIINAPLAHICAVIQDYAQYPAFMPNTAKTSVNPGADKTSLVDITLNLPLGKIKKYRLKMTPTVSPGQCRLDWKQMPWEGLKPEETIADTSGYWLLTPQAGSPDKTVLSYSVFTDPGPVPLGLGWIVDSMSRDSIPKMLAALRGRVK